MRAMGDSALGKEQQGDDFMKEGTAMTKKTFTRWKPDWVAAALSFEQAVKMYKTAKSKAKLIEANTAWAGALIEVGSFFNAANALMSAAEGMSEAGNVDAAVPVYEEAVLQFRTASSGKEAGNALLKCGKALVKSDKSRAESYFFQAMEMYSDEEAFLWSRDCFDYVVKHFIAEANWPQALVSLEKQIDLGIKLEAESISCKAGLSMCIIHLVGNDYTKAIDQENILRSGRIESWLGSTERKYLRSLLVAWECGDQEMYDKASSDVALCLTGQLVRTVKGLTVPEGGIDVDDEPEPEDGDPDPDGLC